MQYNNINKIAPRCVYLLVRLSMATRTSYNSGHSNGYLKRHCGFVILIFLCIALLPINSMAYPDFVISLEEIPEWAPGHPLEIRHIIVGNEENGSVIVTNENTGLPEVSSIALFQYPPDAFVNWSSEYQQYKNFYGIDEDSDGFIVEGNPQTVVLSFFHNAQLMKSVNLSGELAYRDKPDDQFQVPSSLIELRDKLLTYARKAEPQPLKEHYMTAVAYSKNAQDWLLRSTTLESIPTITDIKNERAVSFLTKLIKRMPDFVALERTFFLALKSDLGLSENQYTKAYRISEASKTIVQIKFMGTRDF